MERLIPQVLARLPLAEAAREVFSFVMDDETLQTLYDDFRGSSYTKHITFPLLVRLVSDALFMNKSGLKSFQAARQSQTLPASVEAAYKKLGRVPVAVSVALLNRCSARLQTLFPAVKSETPLPTSLASFTPLVLDGKVTKAIPHRLKPLRGRGGGLVGGKGLVAYHMESGLAVGLSADEDGDANDLRLLPDLLPSVRSNVEGSRLWIADRQFSFLSSLAGLAPPGESFLVRYSKGIPYERDVSVPLRVNRDPEGRIVEDEVGWLGVRSSRQRRRVRRITVKRPGKDSLVIVTNLMEVESYPASDLLQAYRDRPSIESVFQRVTEVFSLRQLIGTSPRATVFQLSLCLLMYNVLQLVRAYLASNANRGLDEVSPKKVLEDVRDQWMSARTVLGDEVLSKRPVAKSAEELRERLRKLLDIWKPRWIKAKRRRGRPEKPKLRSRHDSAFRLLRTAGTPS